MHFIYLLRKSFITTIRLVETTFEDLEDSGCIKVEENLVKSLMLGSIASQYYLSYRTVSMFGSKIGSNTSLEVSTAQFLNNTHFRSILAFFSIKLMNAVGFLGYPFSCLRI